MRKLAWTFCGPIMAAAGINHFVMPKTYEKIMPDYLPAPRELVYASGVAELASAAAFLYPPTRRLGGWGLVATLVGVFPANVDMAIRHERYKGIPRAALLARLPLQAAMLYLVYLGALRSEAER